MVPAGMKRLAILVTVALAGCGSGTVTVTQRNAPAAAKPATVTTTAVQQVLPPKKCGAANLAVARTFHGQIRVSNATSCAFAVNVIGLYAQTAIVPGKATIIHASSPVTGRTYAMACAPVPRRIVCKGGKDALVTFPAQDPAPSKPARPVAAIKAEEEALRRERQANEVRVHESEAQANEREAQNQRIEELRATIEAEQEARRVEAQGAHEKCFAETGELC
jgi:hypothetical protein